MSLTEEQRLHLEKMKESLEKLKKSIEKVLEKDDATKKESDFVDYGSRERREW